MKSLPKSRRQYGTAPMPDFVEFQLAQLVDEPPRGPDWVHEIKFDGYRMQARVENGVAVLRSRTGLDWTARFPEIELALEDLPDCLLDGEICAVTKAGIPTFQGLQSALSSKKTKNLVFFIFDLLWLKGDDKRPYDFETRKAILKRLLEDNERSRLRYVEHMATSGAEMFASACKMKLEGIVSKRKDQRYISNRTGNWVKTKCRKTVDVIIGGWEMNGASLKRLLLGCYRDRKLTYIGGAGTGFNDRNAPRLLKRLREMEIPKMAFETNRPSKSRDKHYCPPEIVCEVQYEEWTNEGKLRQASFKRLREDKAASEIVIDRFETKEDT
jgi:bifunctional non-homologous end joining protein LigD